MPASLPFHFSTSASLSSLTRTALPRTLPPVPAVHAFGIATSGNVTGATTCAELRSKLQPRPNSKLSRCAFARPQPSSCLRAHSAASLYCGEPLRRGPCTSVSCAAVSITCERRKPSSRILPIAAQSRFSRRRKEATRSARRAASTDGGSSSRISLGTRVGLSSGSRNHNPPLPEADAERERLAGRSAPFLVQTARRRGRQSRAQTGSRSAPRGWKLLSHLLQSLASCETNDQGDGAISNKVFVGNLSFDVTKEELVEAFAAVGRVVDAKVPTDRETGRPRGFAFVEFESDEAAEKCIAHMNGRDLKGRAIRVNAAEDRPPRAAGGAGGGFSPRPGGFSRPGGGGGGGFSRPGGGGVLTPRWRRLLAPRRLSPRWRFERLSAARGVRRRQPRAPLQAEARVEAGKKDEPQASA